MLVLTSVAIAVLPFRLLAKLSTLHRETSGEASNDASITLQRLRWAVEATARRLPWKTVCFQKGLAIHWMLRRRGIASRLHYGVTNRSEKGLAAHVWVTHRGEPVIGGEVAEDFTCLATYPSEERANRTPQS